MIRFQPTFVDILPKSSKIGPKNIFLPNLVTLKATRLYPAEPSATNEELGIEIASVELGAKFSRHQLFHYRTSYDIQMFYTMFLCGGV